MVSFFDNNYKNSLFLPFLGNINKPGIVYGQASNWYVCCSNYIEILIIFPNYHNNLALSRTDNSILSIKRIDTHIVILVIQVLGERGKIRKTPLMTKTRLDYGRFQSYIEWLRFMGIVDIHDETVVLTEHGIKISKRF